MRQILFIIVLVFGYKWMVENGYTEDLLGTVKDFNPDSFISFLKSLFGELTKIAETIFEKLNK